MGKIIAVCVSEKKVKGKRMWGGGSFYQITV